MSFFLTIILTAMLLALAGYAQYRIPEYTAGRGKILLTRASLVGVGVAFGAVSVISASGEDVPGILVFLIASAWFIRRPPSSCSSSANRVLGSHSVYAYTPNIVIQRPCRRLF